MLELQSECKPPKLNFSYYVNLSDLGYLFNVIFLVMCCACSELLLTV